MTESRELALLADGARMLSEARGLMEVRDVRSIVIAAVAYARAKDLGEDAIRSASRIVILATVRIGEELIAGQERGEVATRETANPSGLPHVDGDDMGPATLSGLRITRDLSSEAQRLARHPEAVREYLASAPEPSLAGANRAARESWSPAPGLMSSDSPEWYTPRHILDAVVEAMGGIDLDPCAEPAKSVPAAEHYTEAEDGLAQAWYGRVFMNPPYGRPIGAWVGKLVSEYNAQRVTEAVALVPGRIETDWFYALDALWFCNIEGRLAFSDHGTAAPFPSVAVYLGVEGDGFGSAFAGLGDVYERRWPWRGRSPR